ncbi:serine hydrolase domain-containing protein [Nocardia alni]|uniref:serine hydrolase domain-containing protein n=1 Tax=Nocardia alni TaxID=2815723 RepID=UPI001C217324|nr:serine hydrolase domain-containing protein [Nocardia alni]
MPELSEISALANRAVAGGRIPGAVIAARAHGELVHNSAHGVLDTATGYQLQPDTILWLASLSKLIGTAALLMLAEEGRISVDDPVSTYIPEFGTPGRVRVLRPGSPSPMGVPFGPPPDPAPEFDIVPAERELTLFDLLTHTGGLQSIFVWNPEYVVPAPGQTLAEYVPTLGGLVRDFQPGRGWAYGNAASFDVLSRIIELACGQQLDAFLRTRLFEPLGVASLGFGRGGQDGAMPLSPPALSDSVVVQGRTFLSTCAGLWGTGADYLVFTEMLRAGGVHNGRRLLAEKSVETMTTNRIGALCPGLNAREPAPGIGFGLSVAVIEDPVAAGESLPAGTYGWDGVGTRRVWVSPSGGWSLFFYVPDPGVQREIEAAATAALG